MGDVNAMYHRVKVHMEDEDFLRFLWWKDGDLNGPIEEYCMTVQVLAQAAQDSAQTRHFEDVQTKNWVDIQTM